LIPFVCAMVTLKVKQQRSKDPIWRRRRQQSSSVEGSTVATVKVGVDASRAEGFGKDELPLGRERAHGGHATLAVAPATTISVDDGLTEQ
ncbi:hypothetical protein VIGAN_03113400, partial [Vigna angularis var. angularis]